MPKLKQTSITAKKGVNFIRSIVEENGSVFHKIEQDNDFGIDCIIEFFIGENPANKSIGIQIKSGSSYINRTNNTAIIPVDDHYDYWVNYSLPVYGIVYNETNAESYWVDIKKYLAQNPDHKNIVYNISRSNTLNATNYRKLFLPIILGKKVGLSLEESISYFQSQNFDEHHIGMSSLFNNFINREETWDNFIGFIQNKPIDYISGRLIYYIAHIPWHGDIFYLGENINPKISHYGKELISGFDEHMIIKLLSLIDEQTGIMRGSIGESLESIISINKNKKVVLKKIIENNENTETIRIFAAMILAYNDKKEVEFLRKYTSIEIINNIVDFIDKFGEFELYM